MLTFVALVTALVTALGHWVVIARVQGWGTAQSLFGLTQLVMLVGTVVIAEPTDSPYVSYMGLATAIYFAGTVLWASIRPPVRRQRIEVPESLSRPTTGLVILLLISLCLSLFYYLQVGHNAFLVGLGSAGSANAVEAVSELRLDSYATGGYLAAGYVNQFKNVLGPAIAFLLVRYLFQVRHPARWIVVAFAAPSVALVLLGTGQRAAFAQFVVTLVLFMYLERGRRLPARAFALVAVGLLLFGVATVAIGRATAASLSESGPWAVVFQIWKRFFYDNQYSGLLGSRYTTVTPQPLLDGWVNQSLELLPGRSSEVPIDNLIAASIGWGGTMPESLIGSSLTNLGFLGGLIFFLGMAILMGWVTVAALSRSKASAPELIGIAGVFSTFGLWAAGTPATTIQTGLVAYAVLWLWGMRIRRKASGCTPQGDGAAATRTRRPTHRRTMRASGLGPASAGSPDDQMAGSPRT